jgi:phospholipase/carboxylesterase
MYQLVGPVSYEKNYAYPLLLWLHGPGDDERQILRILPHVSLRNYVALGLRGTSEQAAGGGCCWSLDESSIDTAQNAVHAAVEIACERYHVHRDRIFLAGLEAGGTLALRLALAEPQLFGGAISLGGRFPTGGAVLNRFHAARNLPLLLLHGLSSAHYPQEDLCNDLRLFHAARLQVHIRQYACGDEVDSLMLRDLNAWLMERVTGQSLLAERDSASSYC